MPLRFTDSSESQERNMALIVFTEGAIRPDKSALTSEDGFRYVSTQLNMALRSSTEDMSRFEKSADSSAEQPLNMALTSVTFEAWHHRGGGDHQDAES